MSQRAQRRNFGDRCRPDNGSIRMVLLARLTLKMRRDTRRKPTRIFDHCVGRNLLRVPRETPLCGSPSARGRCRDVASPQHAWKRLIILTEVGHGRDVKNCRQPRLASSSARNICDKRELGSAWRYHHPKESPRGDVEESVSQTQVQPDRACRIHLYPTILRGPLRLRREQLSPCRH